MPLSQPLIRSSPLHIKGAILDVKTPNAGRQARRAAGARHERTLAAVAWTPWLGVVCTPPGSPSPMCTQKCHHCIGDRLGLLREQGMPCIGEFDELHTVSERLPERPTIGGHCQFIR